MYKSINTYYSISESIGTKHNEVDRNNENKGLIELRTQNEHSLAQPGELAWFETNLRPPI